MSMEFLGGVDRRWMGHQPMTPNSGPGHTVWIGRLNVCWTTDRGVNDPGVDLAWKDCILLSWNWK